MARKVKYVNGKPTFVEDNNNDGKARFFGKTINELLAMGGKSTPSGNLSSRVDFSDEKIGPKFRDDTKKPIKKITKEKLSVETPSGNIGSLDRTADVIGPDMSKVIKEAAMPKSAREFTAMEMAQNLMSPGYNKKKGGMIKTKKYSKGGSTASKRADGCATKGKTKGRIV